MKLTDILTASGGPAMGDTGEREPVYEGRFVVEHGGGACAATLPDGCVAVLIVASGANAEAHAAARIERAGAGMLAADCRPVAHMVADALVKAGYGRK